MSDGEPIKKRKGRGPSKRPAMFNTSVRLPKEVMDYFTEHYPYSKQAMMREVLLEYVRNKTNPVKLNNIGANHDHEETRPSVQSRSPSPEEARPTPKVNPDYEGLSEEEIDRLVAEQYHKRWTPVG
jgi:hypothetical protein